MLMENFFPEAKQLTCGAMLFFIAALPLQAENSIPALEPNTPIIINADSSEFDYISSRLIFHGLRLDQGHLGIEATAAETDKLDFDNGLWIFTGNVVVETQNAILHCEKARLTFLNHQLAAAELTGAPARFEQTTEETGQINSGEANSIVYKLDTGTLQLNDNAHFFDGANKISGDMITYDLQAQHLKAGSGDSGPVTILIDPPSKNKEPRKKP
jgi:lipopolysaccharide export system protein LptA